MEKPELVMGIKEPEFGPWTLELVDEGHHTDVYIEQVSRGERKVSLGLVTSSISVNIGPHEPSELRKLAEILLEAADTAESTELETSKDLAE